MLAGPPQSAQAPYHMSSRQGIHHIRVQEYCTRHTGWPECPHEARQLASLTRAIARRGTARVTTVAARGALHTTARRRRVEMRTHHVQSAVALAALPRLPSAHSR